MLNLRSKLATERGYLDEIRVSTVPKINRASWVVPGVGSRHPEDSQAESLILGRASKAGTWKTVKEKQMRQDEGGYFSASCQARG
jgi:hypothetical protein